MFVGYGMEDAALGYDDYQGLDVHGKIAVALSGSPKGIDSEVGAHLRERAGPRRRRARRRGDAVWSRPARPRRRFRGRVVESAAIRRRPGCTSDGTPFDPSHGLQAAAIVDPEAAPRRSSKARRRRSTQVLDEADRPGGRPKGSR